VVNARQVDEKRRVTLPEEFAPGSDVLIERVAANTWIITRYRRETNLKVLLIPVIERLPDDPEWDKVENALGRAAYGKLPPPPED
jgi:DNA-binding transcriptional regulator/RsmH inhibitor MraZ